MSSDNFIFYLALLIFFLFAGLEIVSALIGISFSDSIHSLDASFEIDSPLQTPSSGFSNILWVLFPLRVRGVPMLIVLLIFLLFFGATGLILQHLSLTYLKSTQPLLYAIPLTLGISYPFSRWAAHGAAYVIPRDTTSAVSLHSLVGSIAEITLGKARAGSGAQAKVKDQFGKMHYSMLEPENPEDEFSAGEKVLLVRRAKGRFYAVKIVEKNN